MRYLFFILLVIFPFIGESQVEIAPRQYNYGDIYTQKDRIADFVIRNNTDKEIFILSIAPPKGVAYRKESDLIPSGDSTRIRFQIRKLTNGDFDYSVPVYTSNSRKPFIIHLEGAIKTGIDKKDDFSLTACPTFGERPSIHEQLSFNLTIQTVDSATGKPLKNSHISLINRKIKKGSLRTKNNGVVRTKVEIGRYLFQAKHKGYQPTASVYYVNPRRNFVRIRLKKIEKKEPIEEIVEKKTPKEPSKDTIPTQPITEIDSVNQPSVAHLQFSAIDSANFSKKYFRPINVVFVLDISGSMLNYGRISILRHSLEHLVKMLRPQDKIGIISYAENAETIIRSTSGSHKKRIIQKIKDIEVGGRTAGGKAIKKGYKLAKKNEIEGGVSHVIIITDGAFNLGSNDYKEYIKENVKNDVTMSVVGIKCNITAEKDMREVAHLGHGRLLLIDHSEEIDKLNQEIRWVSFRYH